MEKQKLNTVSPEDFARYFGLATWLMTMSKEHKSLSVSDLDKRILPAMVLSQFRLFYKDKIPMAFLTWANVTPDLKKKVESEGYVLTLEEWRSGKEIIVVDCISPFGPAEKIKTEFFNSFEN